MAKLSKEELVKKVSEKVTDEDLAIELMEDISDSLDVSEDTEKEEMNKILWFLSGVAYANGGNLKKIAKRTYMITPYNVDVLGDLLDELESNGMFFV